VNLSEAIDGCRQQANSNEWSFGKHNFLRVRRCCLTTAPPKENLYNNTRTMRLEKYLLLGIHGVIVVNDLGIACVVLVEVTDVLELQQTLHQTVLALVLVVLVNDLVA